MWLKQTRRDWWIRRAKSPRENHSNIWQKIRNSAVLPTVQIKHCFCYFGKFWEFTTPLCCEHEVSSNFGSSDWPISNICNDSKFRNRTRISGRLQQAEEASGTQGGVRTKLCRAVRFPKLFPFRFRFLQDRRKGLRVIVDTGVVSRKRHRQDSANKLLPFRLDTGHSNSDRMFPS